MRRRASKAKAYAITPELGGKDAGGKGQAASLALAGGLRGQVFRRFS